MKKAIFILFILVVILLTQIDKSDELVIPKDAIRYRIIANSNSEEDQNLKREINKEIEPINKNIEILNCFQFEEVKDRIEQIAKEHEKVINNIR